jgi:Family of unknown function (DUF6152)
MGQHVKYHWIAGASLAAFAVNQAAFAHHSTANYDHKNKVLVEGTIKQFKWSNPHSWVFMSVPNEQGGNDDWALECGTIGQLMQIGWTREQIKSGDKVKIVASIARDGSNRGEIETLITAAGKELKNRVGY